MKRLLSEWIHLLLPDRNYIPRKIFFRVDAGNRWGLSFGHLFRCILLANVFKKSYDSEIIFLMRNYADGIQYARDSGLSIKVLPESLQLREERESIVELAEQFEANVLVVDLPYQNVDTSYFSSLRRKGLWIIFLDDSRFISPTADVILNSSIRASDKIKKVKNIRYLLGPRYFLYEGPQCADCCGRKGENLHVVITFGGSDPFGLTGRVLRALAQKRWRDVEFTIILGPGNIDVERVQMAIQKNPNKMRLSLNPPALSLFFLKCDLAICAGGRTLYELNALNVPAFAIASIEHEALEIRAFLQHNMLSAGLEAWNTQEFITQLAQILTFLRVSRA